MELGVFSLEALPSKTAECTKGPKGRSLLLAWSGMERDGSMQIGDM